METRETDSPTPPLHNHVMNNVDYVKDETRDKNSFNEENHVKIEGSLARCVSRNEVFNFRLCLNAVCHFCKRW